MKVDAESIINKIKSKKIVVIMGGLSAERKISLLTGQAMLKSLKQMKLSACGLDIKKTRDILKLFALKPDVVVNGLHGPGGEDGNVQGFLEWFKIPYTGSGVMASALSMDKHRAKLMMKAIGLPTAPWVCLSPDQLEIPPNIKLPVVIKPNAQGSAIGVAIAKTQKDVIKAFDQAKCFGDHILVEKYMKGIEISVGVIDGLACPVIEIVPKNEFYDYEAKYVVGMSNHIIPARLTKAKTKEVQKLAVKTAALFGCQGTPRVDMIVMPGGKVVILEVNTLPGMTATSLLPDVASYVGLGFDGIVLKLIIQALGEDK